ncbi:MAG: hypothetical protein B7Z73_13555 [Planctomycetia bacterium 21-64-5]|nr:MAG: hypothetical protein B7Z73_13555 [Planctomycetia bacterium 21-64-5]HQU42815.1 response regulator [Pirellulales bacterium]
MRASILITDDDRGFRETLRGVFEPEGFHTLLAENGAEALDIVRHSDIHLLLLDMHMPRLTGLETLRIVKQMKSRLPCILLSAHPDEGLVRQAFEADAFSFLTKPVSRQTITSTVRLALANTYDWAVEASDDHEVEPGPRDEQEPAPPAFDPRLFRRDT